jgi:uncharacterized protein YbjT (DUF2867 family)
MILVVGATGDLGGRVVRRLRQQGEQVRCLVRPASNDSGLRALGANVATGDLTEPASLREACSGVDTVIASATAIGRELSGMRTPTVREVDGAGMLSLVEAAERAGVNRFVFVSYAGAPAGLGSPLERAKVAVEQRLSRSPLSATLVRPDAFQEIHLAPMGRFDIDKGKVAVFGKGDSKRRWVGTEDVAALIAAVAVEPDPPSVIEFGGSEKISRNEAIATAERITGRKIKRQRMPRPVARVGLRLLARPKPALASVFGAGLMQDLVEATWDDQPLQDRGIVPTPASECIRRQCGNPDTSRSS